MALPKLASCEGVSWGVECSDVFWKVHLVLGNDHFGWKFLFILEPSIRDTQVKISCDLYCRVSPQKDLPMVIHRFQNRSKSDIQRSHILKDERIPENLNLLTFRVGNNLTSNIDLVREVKDIKTNIVCKVSIVNLLKWRKSKFNNMLNLFSCDLYYYYEYTPGTLLMTSSTSIWQ